MQMTIHGNIIVVMSLIKGDSLLSSISNISVMIQPGQGSSIFNFSMLHPQFSPEYSQKMCEVKLNDIFPDPMSDNNSMLDRIMRRDER